MGVRDDLGICGGPEARGRAQHQKEDRPAEQIGHDLRRPDRGIVDAEDIDERLVGERQHV
jgi:hypothetical protein